MKHFWISTSLLVLASCANSDGTSTGNPLVSVRFNSYAPSMTSKTTTMSVSNLKMCFKRLRFKPVSNSDQNIDLNLGELEISPTGTMVTAQAIPAGSYSRIEFDLDSDCASQKSVQLSNNNGSFSTDDSMTIRFEGLMTVSASQEIDLNIQAIISALNSVNSNNDIKTKAESVSGSF